MKRVLIVVFALLLALAIISCGNLAVDKKGEGTGSIVINLGGSARSAEVPLTLKGQSHGSVYIKNQDEVTDYQLILSTPEKGMVYYKKIAAASTIVFDDIPSGEYFMSFTAFDGDISFAYADMRDYSTNTQKKVQILEDEDTVLSLDMKYGALVTLHNGYEGSKAYSYALVNGFSEAESLYPLYTFASVDPFIDIFNPDGKVIDYWTDSDGNRWENDDDIDLDGLTLPIVFTAHWKDATNPPGGGTPAGFVRFAGGTVDTSIPNSNSSGPFGSDRTYNGDFPITINPFYLAETELTYARWYEVYSQKDTKGYSFCNEGLNGYDNFGGTGDGGGFPTTGEDSRTDYPVTTINWRDAVVWCNLASELEGLTPVYWEQGTTDFNDTSKVIRISETDKPTTGDGKAENAVINPDANGYRLPTDEEWEFAARGGIVSSDTDAPWNWEYLGASTAEGTAVYYNTASDAGSHTVPVKQFESYAGVYDMIGNVKEFVVNPRKASSYNRPIRGGSYASVYKKFYDIYDGVSCTQTSQYIGFRVARNAN